MENPLSVQVAVIGAGPAGYPAAFRAADLGLSVALIDLRTAPGGVCLHQGCIPSKALLHAAHIKDDADNASSFGLHFEEPHIDLNELRTWKDGIIQQLTGGLAMLCKQRSISYIQGKAIFTNPHELQIDTEEGPQTLQFEQALIATGSRPIVIPGLDFNSECILSARDALQLKDIPEKMLVIGGGYIGLELGSVYASLGSKVSVVEMSSSLLPGVDKDLVRVLARNIEPKFAQILLNTQVIDAQETADGITVKMSDNKGDASEESFDRVLVAVGRRPWTDDLGLENTAVEIDEKGFIITDSACRTAETSIFAAGDVTGQPMLAHKATHEAIVAAENMAGQKKEYAPGAIPAVIFTDPEIAWCGVTETEVKEKKLNAKIIRYPWSASGRAKTNNILAGSTKLIFDKENGRLLGMAIAGQGAGEMISEGVLALEKGATAEDLSHTIHPHPTLSETIMEAADIFLGKSIHMVNRR